jgi:hypothetical protein
VQIRVLVERAKQGDFDELNSDAELLDYLSPAKMSGTPAGSNPSRGLSGSAPLRAELQKDSSTSANAIAASPSPRAASHAATVGSLGSSAALAGDSFVSGGLTAQPSGDVKAVQQPMQPRQTSAGPSQAGLAVAGVPQANAASSQQAAQLAAGAKQTVSTSSHHSTSSNAVPAWVHESSGRAGVRAALDLHGKLRVALALPPADAHRPLWLAAVAIKATQLGLAAVQGATIRQCVCAVCWLQRTGRHEVDLA